MVVILVNYNILISLNISHEFITLVELLMKKLFILFSAGLLSLSVQASENTDWSKLKSKKQTTLGLYMTPTQANDYMKKHADKALFIDVRTRPEVNFLGMPNTASANVPYMKLNDWYSWNAKKKNFDMEVNSDFAVSILEQVKSKGLTKNDTLILICRSGSRSSKAANLLTKLGYTKVYSIPEGFEGDKSKALATKGQRVVNGWKNAGLPWSYKLQVSKMYKVGE